MELLLISEEKLKVTLSAEDMEKYEISCDSIDYDSTETRKAFWSILDEAKHRTGFDAAQDRVYIQIYPSRSGGCEMYVTKLEGEEKSLVEKEKEQGKAFCVESEQQKSVFRFSKEENAEIALELLASSGSSYSFFKDKNGEIYMIVCPKNKDDIQIIERISEYGDCICFSGLNGKGNNKRRDFQKDKKPSELAQLYIEEHFEKITLGKKRKERKGKRNGLGNA